MPYAELGAVRLYYERGGDGPELLFVPGWCCDHTFYAPQFDHFAASCTVTSIDPRGCGQSSRPDDGYDIQSLAETLTAFVAGMAGPRGEDVPKPAGPETGSVRRGSTSVHSPWRRRSSSSPIS